MELKTPLRIKFKIGSGGTSTPEPQSPNATVVSRMTEEDADQIGSEEDMEEDWHHNNQVDESLLEVEGSEISHQHFVIHEDSTRERHKKSKKKKKKKEKDRERHKHKHHRDREIDDEEPIPKKAHLEVSQPQPPSKAELAAFKELLEYLLQMLQKRDSESFFSLPVTDNIAPGYSIIIKQPMDFSQMTKKVQDGAYLNLANFEIDLRLICNNCIEYNQTDTIYFKAARKLLHSGEKIFIPERIVRLKTYLPNLMSIPKELIGFDIQSVNLLCTDTEDPNFDPMKCSDTENSQDMHSKFEPLQDNLTAEQILEQAKNAAKEAAEKLTLKKPVCTLGFLRQQGDGTTTLNFLTGCEGNDPNQKSKPISLGLLTGKLTQGTSSLNNFKDDKRSMAKPVKPLYYGAFSSFCPSYDSTFANITKEESEMVFATYGNETAVQYAESICCFSRDCDMAMHLVDQLLNLLTHEQHSKTKAVIEERRRIQQEEQKIASFLPIPKTEPTQPPEDQKPSGPNFSNLKSLSELGINTNFLKVFEQMEQHDQNVKQKLDATGALLETLAKEQRDRLSRPLPQNLNNLPPPSASEVKLAEKVSETLVSVARQVPPGALAPVPIVRRALGITMLPVTSEASEQIEVDIEETSSQEATPPQSHSKEANTGYGLPMHGHVFPENHRNPEHITDKRLKEMLNS